MKKHIPYNTGESSLQKIFEVSERLLLNATKNHWILTQTL